METSDDESLTQILSIEDGTRRIESGLLLSPVLLPLYFGPHASISIQCQKSP